MEKTRSLGLRSLADGIGILGSAACALHCAVTPIFLVAGTTLPASLVPDERFHLMLFWAILPASVLAFGLGCWRHRDRRVLLLGALGLFGLSSAVALPHELIGESGERWMTVGSAGLLISAHAINFKRCRADECDHEAAGAEGR